MSAAGRDTGGNPIRLLLHVPVPWVYVLTYLAGVGLQMAFPWHVRKSGPPLIAGWAVFAVGLAIAGWGWTIFHNARTTTVPGEASSQLIRRGPYRMSRNPMYVGLAIAYLGEAGLQNQVWPMVLLPLTLAYVNWIVIPVEEERLNEVFPGEYERYRKSVRRWL
jgi:protein-S-isoprenylcysteine O-methyltransferase Ste14